MLLTLFFTTTMYRHTVLEAASIGDITAWRWQAAGPKFPTICPPSTFQWILCKHVRGDTQWQAVEKQKTACGGSARQQRWWSACDAQGTYSMCLIKIRYLCVRFGTLLIYLLADLCGTRAKNNSRKFGIRAALNQKIAPLKLLTISYCIQCLRFPKSKFVITLIINVHNY